VDTMVDLRNTLSPPNSQHHGLVDLSEDLFALLGDRPGEIKNRLEGPGSGSQKYEISGEIEKK